MVTFFCSLVEWALTGQSLEHPVTNHKTGWWFQTTLNSRDQWRTLCSDWNHQDIRLCPYKSHDSSFIKDNNPQNHLLGCLDQELRSSTATENPPLTIFPRKPPFLVDFQIPKPRLLLQCRDWCAAEFGPWTGPSPQYLRHRATAGGHPWLYKW